MCSGFALEDLTVDNNSFTGSLPECLRNCSKLHRVRLDGNKFTGNITEAFGVHQNLNFLALRDNQFVGHLSSMWGECRNLTNLQMDRNRISGKIPVELGKLTKLQVLTLDSNKLSGEIPDELGNLGLLYRLNLSQNHMTGELPKSLGNLSKLQHLDLSENSLTGNIPVELGNCNGLLTLNLSHNKIAGGIPSKLGNLVSLQYMLDLSSNSLSGTIPQNLGKLTAVEYLNLSHNHLSGRIPEALSSMVSLHSIDFSYNNLTGETPTGKIFQQVPAKSYVGNSGLCGKVEGLTPCSPVSLPHKSSNSTKKVLLGAIVWVSGLLCLATVIVGILVYSQTTKFYDEEGSSIKYERFESLIWEREAKFMFGDILNSTEDFNEKYCIGKGGFGSVYKAVLPTGQVVAVKRLNISDSSDIPTINRRSFENEIRTLTEVRHRHIIKLYGFCSWKRCLFLVYEYVERGSLRNVLYGVEGAAELGWSTRVKIVQGVAHAMAYLHHDCFPPIVHRDVSLNNILLEMEFEPRLSDFGTARLLSSESSNWTTIAGSYGYMAPGNRTFY